LPHGASAFASQPVLRQRRFQVCAHDQFIAKRHNFFGDGVQKLRPAFGGKLPVSVKRLLGSLQRSIHFFRSCLFKLRLDVLALRGGKRRKLLAKTFDFSVCDDVFSV
jgi:hypothetical protein